MAVVVTESFTSIRCYHLRDDGGEARPDGVFAPMLCGKEDRCWDVTIPADTWGQNRSLPDVHWCPSCTTEGKRRGLL